MLKLFKSSWGDIFAIMAGILYTLAFSPFDFPIFAFISLAIFRLLICQLTTKKAILRGFLFGLGLFGSGVSWVFVSMVINEQTSFMMPASMTLFYCSFWATFPAISAYLFVKLQSNEGFDCLLFSCAWVFVEYIRGEWVLNGFPWLQISYSQLDTPLSAFVPISGVYGTSLICAMIASLLAEIILGKHYRSKCIAVVMVFLIFGVMLKKVNWTTTSGGSIKVALIQGNIAQKDKWVLENRNITLKQYYDDSAKHWDSDIIIWPETAVPQLLNFADDTLAAIASAADGVPVITGIQRRQDKRYFNSLVVLDALGVPSLTYDKTHLVPFGEYVPFGNVLARFGITGFASQTGSGYSAGPGPQILDLAIGKALPLICYEAVFPQLLNSAPARADMLIQVTNDAWFGTYSGPYQHLVQARMRAAEQGLPMIRVANTGVSAMIDGYGRIRESLPLGEAGFVDARLPQPLAPTLYSRTGDIPVFVLLLILSGFVAARSRRPTSS